MQNEQFNELLKAILTLRESVEVQGTKIDSLTNEVVSVKADVSTLKGNVSTLTTEVASLREDMTEVKGRVMRIEETMVTKDDLKAFESRLMGEITPLKETVAYLSEQSASHDRKLFLLKNPQKP